MVHCKSQVAVADNLSTVFPIVGEEHRERSALLHLNVGGQGDVAHRGEFFFFGDNVGAVVELHEFHQLLLLPGSNSVHVLLEYIGEICA